VRGQFRQRCNRKPPTEEGTLGTEEEAQISAQLVSQNLQWDAPKVGEFLGYFADPARMAWDATHRDGGIALQQQQIVGDLTGDGRRLIVGQDRGTCRHEDAFVVAAVHEFPGLRKPVHLGGQSRFTMEGDGVLKCLTQAAAGMQIHRPGVPLGNLEVILECAHLLGLLIGGDGPLVVQPCFSNYGRRCSRLGQQSQVWRQCLQAAVCHRTGVNTEAGQNATGEALRQIEDGAHGAGFLGDGDNGGYTDVCRLVESAVAQLVQMAVGVGKLERH